MKKKILEADVKIEEVIAKSKIYFSAETEAAIILYNNTIDPEERELIYRKHIEYPFNKLAENIINRFKFPYVNQTFEDLKQQVVSFLAINLAKFSEGKGKAFSYFSVIAKNYLILHNNNGYKHAKRSISLTDVAWEGETPLEDILEIETPNYENQEEAREFVKLMVFYWDNNITRVFKKKRDIDIATAVVELFRRAENIENYNKKALYLMIREMTNCKTSYITKVVNKMREQVLEHLDEYREHGVIDSKQSKFFTYQ